MPEEDPVTEAEASDDTTAADDNVAEALTLSVAAVKSVEETVETAEEAVVVTVISSFLHEQEQKTSKADIDSNKAVILKAVFFILVNLSVD